MSIYEVRPKMAVLNVVLWQRLAIFIPKLVQKSSHKFARFSPQALPLVVGNPKGLRLKVNFCATSEVPLGEIIFIEILKWRLWGIALE